MTPRRGVEKRLDLEGVARAAAGWRARGETVVLMRGTFDLLQAAHAKSLATARALGARLVVAVLGDLAATRLEGRGHPVLAAAQRATLVAALRCVDHVVVIEVSQWERLLSALDPDRLALEPPVDRRAARRSKPEPPGPSLVVVEDPAGPTVAALIARIRERGSRR